MEELDWFIGFDWASEKHRACICDHSGRLIAERDVVHGGAGLGEFFAWLMEKTAAQPTQIGIAIETPHGPIVEGALERGFRVYALNPKQLDRFRDRFTVAGAKDDSRDTHVLSDALRTDRHAFRRVAIDDPIVIELREWSRLAEDLTQERNRLTNRVREQLWRYYPQALKLSDDLGIEWFIALWLQAPTPKKAARLNRTTVGRIFKAHRVTRLTAEEALRILRETPLTVAAGAVEAATAHIETVFERLRLVNAQLKKAHKKLDELCARLQAQEENEPGQAPEQRDVTILRSCPGVGRTVLATLLGEARQPLERRDYHVLRVLSGAAPVTRRSGKSCLVVRRQACNKRLQQALYHWARVAVQHDPACRSRYAELRRRGHSHGRALRTVGDRLLRVACTLLERQVPFDPLHTSNPGQTQAAAA